MYSILLETPDPDISRSEFEGISITTDSGDRALPAQTSLWSHPVLMTEAARLQDLEPKLLVVYKSQFRAAELPLYERRRLGTVSLQPASGSYYQGLRFWHQKETSPPRRLLDELQISSQIAVWLKDRYRKLLFNLSPENYDTRGFTWNKLRALPLYTFIHNLNEDIYPLRDEREKLRRADQRAYSFERGLDIDAFLDLNDAMFQRKGHHAYNSQDQMRTYIANLHKAGLLEQYNVCLDGQVVSTNILLTGSDGRAYTVLRASRKEELPWGVSLWHTHMLIKTLKDHFVQLDLCGANVADVARFKAAMGLSLKVFFRIST